MSKIEHEYSQILPRVLTGPLFSFAFPLELVLAMSGRTGESKTASVGIKLIVVGGNQDKAQIPYLSPKIRLSGEA